MPAPARVAAHADPLDVARTQCSATVQQPPLHDRRVSDQRVAVPHKRVHSAQHVLPIRIRQLSLEDLDEQRARRVQGRTIEISSVRDA